MAGRRNPFKELEEMLERMGRQVEESTGRPDISQLTGDGTAIDVADHGDEFVVTADLPGYSNEDIDLSLRENQLHIHAERDEEREEGEEGRYIRRERRRQSVSRSVSLPEDVDEEGATAQYQNGVLSVTLPKHRGEESDSYQIDVS